MTRAAPASSSTKTARGAPRLSASMPQAPLPAKQSSTGAPQGSSSSDSSDANSDCLTLSEIGPRPLPRREQPDAARAARDDAAGLSHRARPGRARRPHRRAAASRRVSSRWKAGEPLRQAAALVHAPASATLRASTDRARCAGVRERWPPAAAAGRSGPGPAASPRRAARGRARPARSRRCCRGARPGVGARAARPSPDRPHGIAGSG